MRFRVAAIFSSGPGRSSEKVRAETEREIFASRRFFSDLSLRLDGQASSPGDQSHTYTFYRSWTTPPGGKKRKKLSDQGSPAISTCIMEKLPAAPVRIAHFRVHTRRPMDAGSGLPFLAHQIVR